MVHSLSMARITSHSLKHGERIELVKVWGCMRAWWKSEAIGRCLQKLSTFPGGMKKEAYVGLATATTNRWLLLALQPDLRTTNAMRLQPHLRMHSQTRNKSWILCPLLSESGGSCCWRCSLEEKQAESPRFSAKADFSGEEDISFICSAGFHHLCFQKRLVAYSGPGYWGRLPW